MEGLFIPVQRRVVVVVVVVVVDVGTIVRGEEWSGGEGVWVRRHRAGAAAEVEDGGGFVTGVGNIGGGGGGGSGGSDGDGGGRGIEFRIWRRRGQLVIGNRNSHS